MRYLLLLFLLSFCLPAGNAQTMIYLSQDQGTSWQPLDAGLPQGAVLRAVTQQEEDLWLATDVNGVYRLPAGATAWEHRSNGLPEDVFVTSMAVNGDIIAVGTYRHGIFVSPDRGRYWRRPIANPIGVAVQDLHFTNGIIVAATDRGIFRSYDGGLGWIGDPSDYLQVNALTEMSERMLAGRRDGIMISRDGGSHWTKVWDGGEIWDFAVDGNTLYAFGRYNLRSTDGGKTWKEFDPATSYQTSPHNLYERRWRGITIKGPEERVLRAVTPTHRGWIAGVGAGC